jgi:integrase
VERIIAAANPHLARLTIFLVLVGARLGETLKLQWVDVDLDARWAVFRNTKRNGEDRGVPLHECVVAMLRTIGPQRSGFVFLNHRGDPYAEKIDGGGQIKSAWRATLKRSEVAPMRVHDLRHTAATWMLMAGIDEYMRDEILGHASTQMGRRYAHVPRQYLVEAIDKLPSLKLVITIQRGRDYRLPRYPKAK